MKCERCGNETDDKSEFCGNCGSTLNPYMDQGDFADDQTSEGNKGLSIASMTLGIVSLVLCCTVYGALVCALVGLVLGIVARYNNNPGKGMAIAGIVCSSVELFLLIVLLAVAGLGFSSMSSSLPGFFEWHSAF